jgi:hypothetical protein
MFVPVDADQGAAARGEGHRAERRAQEVGAQRVHRGGEVGGGCGALDPGGEHPADRSGMTPQLAVVARREQEQRRRHADGQRDGPPQQPFFQRARGGADGKDEGQQRRALSGRDDLAEHPGKGDQRPEDECQRHRQPRNGRGQGPQTDQHRPVHAETAVGQRPGVHVAGEVGHDQQGDRAEDREQRCLRPAADGESDRRRDGDDDGRAQRAPCTVVFGVARVRIRLTARRHRPAGVSIAGS